ncbi:MAG: DUF2911 domain-containing protein [Reichenbachiella sp.]|uniref:DUF2911 domain-containing protein n=1 Tax=Reichenbachiella sp. TaxID=2184521 RepID=UPI003265EB6B
MMKKIIIGVVLAIVAYFAYGVLTTRSHSPLDTAETSIGDLSVKVVYCQPYKKGRLIFGDEADEALVPYGKYWRLGANEATEITFSKDINFAGNPVAAGSYRMYAVPNVDSWEVSLNSQLGEFGYFEPDYSLDVLKANVPVQSAAGELEQFTIQFANDSIGTQMNMMWDKTLVSVSIAEQ